MRVTQRVKKILSSYEGDNPGTKTALARILMEGKLGGTGRALILPIDHGFSKGLVPKFSGAEPDYHFQLAADGGLNALAAPLEMLEIGADNYAGSIPLILQMQVGDPFVHGATAKSQGSVRDALRLGCVGISCAVVDPDKGNTDDFAALINEAKACGLFVMSWVSAMKESGEADTSVAAISRAAKSAGELGAHLVCVRVPVAAAPLSDSIRQVSRSCGRKITAFAGSFIADDTELFEEMRGIRDGGAQSYVLPPNCLYRPYDEALSILDKSLNIYQGKA